ncbi:MAG: FxsA family protein [Thermodesulfobacteriota bacterium]|nr:FxsA family protein [Thermodesulfobacteriota bacterium]
MFIKLLIVFTVVPIIELYVLIEAGRQIGVGATIGMIFLTGIAGAYLARSQGFNLINRIQTEMYQGRIPAEEMMDGAMILSGGLLLLTPGFCTDLFGFCLLTPVTRQFFKVWLKKWLDLKIQQGEINFRQFR